MKIITVVILVVVLGLFLKGSYPDTYNQTFGNVIGQTQAMWDERKDSLFNGEQNVDEVRSDGSLDTVREGTVFGRPFDEIIHAFDCTSDAQCQQRFSVFALCDDSGECYQGPTK